MLLKDEKELERMWAIKKTMVLNQLSHQTGNLIHDIKQIQKYQCEESYDDKASIGSISSADERDLELIMSGEHTNFFEASELIRNFSRKKQKRQQEIQE